MRKINLNSNTIEYMNGKGAINRSTLFSDLSQNDNLKSMNETMFN